MEQNKIEMIAYEAFIRRACLVDMPFMLKGSYVTRQYFDNPENRVPMDLDFVYLERINNVEDSEKIFNDWASKVTELELDDGVKFRSFQENAFWRMIDYAMSEDFPTVDTDLICWVDGKKCDLSIDISFNLDISEKPIPINYQPVRGASFVISQTVPLALQVSWKLHQTLVRPRFKDIFDLIHLLRHSDFNKEVLEQSLNALVKECIADEVDVQRLKFALNRNLERLFAPVRINAQWAMWRRDANYDGTIYYYENASHITDISKLPKDLESFEKQFSDALKDAGINDEKIENLPKTKRKATKKKVESKQTNQKIFTRDKPVSEDKNKGILDFLADLFK